MNMKETVFVHTFGEFIGPVTAASVANHSRWSVFKAAKQLTTLDVHELTHGVEKRGKEESNTGTVVQFEGCLSQKKTCTACTCNIEALFF